VSCAWPSTAVPLQEAAVALQNVTNPGCTLMPPEFTVAFSVTGLGHLMGLGGTVSVVVVAVAAQIGALAAHNKNPIAIARLRAYFWHLFDMKSSD